MSTDAKAPTAAPVRGRRIPEPSPVIRRSKKSKAPLFLILPTIVVLVAALGYPVGWQLVTSFKKFGLKQQFGVPAEFVGFENYITLLTSSELWIVVGRSLLFCLVAASLTVAIGGLLALLMQRVGTAGRLILQVSMLLAWAMPVVAAMTVWVWLIDWRRGVLNWILVRFGVDAEGHNWLADPISFFMIAIIIVVWMSVPFVALSIYAGLTQISGEVLEAAAMDGATGWQRTRHIIIPLITPVLSIVLLLQLIWDLRVFTQIKLLQDAGGFANETNLLGTYIYQLGVGSGDYGMASAVSVFMLILTIAISWYYVRSLMKEEN
ncbi:N,N'-diacetylchitobiose transport system permease protein [Arthrobacter stackebrandtii]|uniref:N,N'-diacetylchitobiose transport system permease protein n=1 Tax=Arthrobacter stackebrandtii TaxID=272161 RepID=A0ABS4YRK8_9MICC|nr:sugar ABC transporter permease [Arthrobacter stackebrandtii]MBP2411426.1 N,N'-diacetylchitobiose transport system permease protein [Arthrobacter stackebrandtii]PYH00289.1 sugar ABC transporter permease [Arthrobacter stackebrandtii]